MNWLINLNWAMNWEVFWLLLASLIFEIWFDHYRGTSPGFKIDHLVNRESKLIKAGGLLCFLTAIYMASDLISSQLLYVAVRIVFFHSVLTFLKHKEIPGETWKEDLQYIWEHTEIYYWYDLLINKKSN